MRYARQSHGNNISNTKSYWEYIIICAVQHTQLDERVSCMQGLIRCAREYVRSGEASAVTVTLIKMYEAYFIEMWDALGNNPLLFSYFFYYRLRYIYKISNDNLQVDFDEGTIPPASAPAISCYDFFAHTRTTSTHTSTCIHTIYIPKIIAHMALCVEQQAREREHLTQMLHFLCIVESVSIYRLAIPILFSNVFPHAENTLYFASLLWIQSLKCDSLLRWLLCVLNVYYFHSPPTVFIPRTLICVFFSHTSSLSLCIGITYLGMVRKAFKI